MRHLVNKIIQMVSQPKVTAFLAVTGNLALYFLYVQGLEQQLETWLFEVHGKSQMEATFVTQLVSIAYIVALPSYLVWAVWGHLTFRALIATAAIVGMPLLLNFLFASDDNCFNQRTGVPLQWYVVRSSNEIVTATVRGYDTLSQQERKPVTPEICRIIHQQAQGIRPNEITEEVSQIDFFDSTSGFPKVWFSEDVDGNYKFFDAEGFYLGEKLEPITRVVVEKVRSQAREAKGVVPKQIENTAPIDQEPQIVETVDEPVEIDVFGAANFKDETLFIGVVPHGAGRESRVAASELEAALIAEAQQRNFETNSFPRLFFKDRYFDNAFAGDVQILQASSLSPIMLAAILAEVDATCKPSSVLEGVYSCRVNVELRLIDRGATGSSKIVLKRTTAGASIADALSQAARALVSENPQVIDFVSRERTRVTNGRGR